MGTGINWVSTVLQHLKTVINPLNEFLLEDICSPFSLGGAVRGCAPVCRLISSSSCFHLAAVEPGGRAPVGNARRGCNRGNLGTNAWQTHKCLSAICLIHCCHNLLSPTIFLIQKMHLKSYILHLKTEAKTAGQSYYFQAFIPLISLMYYLTFLLVLLLLLTTSILPQALSSVCLLEPLAPALFHRALPLCTQFCDKNFS